MKNIDWKYVIAHIEFTTILTTLYYLLTTK